MSSFPSTVSGSDRTLEVRIDIEDVWLGLTDPVEGQATRRRCVAGIRLSHQDAKAVAARLLGFELPRRQ